MEKQTLLKLLTPSLRPKPAQQRSICIIYKWVKAVRKESEIK
jgi:hypothetical protein